MLRVTKIKEAAYLAISLHGTQTYDGHPYYYHLEQVVDVLKEFGFTEDKFVIAGYLHDVLEDTAISYNDIKTQFGEEIAEIVYAVTDELGRNRKERKAKTYPKIKANPDATIVKLADRIANTRNSIKNKPSMAKMYAKELEGFRDALYVPNTEAESLWNELSDILIVNEVI
jgi:(p)ppGpp synthase/HD superfamily hydrolase